MLYTMLSNGGFMDSIKVHVSGEKWMGEGGFAGESLWATRLSSNTAKIDNTPFFTYGLSLHDTVLIDGENEILSVVEPSGLRNIRAILPEGTDIDAIFANLKALGATVEGFSGGVMLAATVSENLLKRVTDYFDSLNLAWENGN